MGLLGYFVYRSLSLLLGQHFIGFLRFSLLRLTSPYFSAFGFLRLYLPCYWISPLLFTLVDFSDCWISAFWISPLLFTVLIGFFRFYLQCLLDFSASIYFG